MPLYEATDAALPLGTETILLVEDEAGVRGLAKRVLSDLGYTVIEAADGDEALRIVQTQAKATIDLLLTDVVMPKLGGKPLVERLAITHPNIRVLFTSGYTEWGIVYQGRLGQGVAFLQKPFSAATLARKVREVLDS
jgi:CheY-like chemotaxis protein